MRANWLFLLLGSVFTYTLDTGNNIISIPFSLNGKDGITSIVELSFDVFDDSLELNVIRFCEEHDIQSFFCRKVYDIAYDRLKAAHDALLLRRTSSKQETVPNPHWDRHTTAIEAELSSTQEKQRFIEEITKDEESSYQSLQNTLDILENNSSLPERIVFIHSCLLPNTSTDILLDLLKAVYSQDLQALVIVLQYGLPVFISLSSEKTHPSLFVNQFVSPLTNFFEIPSIRIIHRLSQHLNKHDTLPRQILYLHSKGISYLQRHEQIEDWKKLMLHFLVFEQHMCYHLLKSQAFDVIGVNYHSHPRALSGNYWWALSTYLSRLAVISYEDTKYAPERWVLTDRAVRLFVPHTSRFQHSEERYPKYCYAPSLSTSRRGKEGEGWEEREGGESRNRKDNEKKVSWVSLAGETVEESRGEGKSEEERGELRERERPVEGEERREERIEVPGFEEWSRECLNEREEEYEYLHGEREERGRGRESVRPLALLLFNP